MKTDTFRKPVSILRIVLIVLSLLPTQFARLDAAVLRASPCTLAWDKCQNNLACGYVVYYGLKGSTTTNRLNVGLTNAITFQNLTASSNYYFYVTAYGVCGIESPPSGLIAYTPQVFSSLKLGRPANGTMTLHFQVATGAVCHVEYTPTLNPAQWQSLGTVTADATGNASITDALSGNPAARFYRTVLP